MTEADSRSWAGDLEKALEVYQAGLKVEPTLAMLLKGVEEVKQASMEVDSEGGIGALPLPPPSPPSSSNPRRPCPS